MCYEILMKIIQNHTNCNRLRIKSLQIG